MLGMDKVSYRHFSTVLTRNLQNRRDYAPLRTGTEVRENKKLLKTTPSTMDTKSCS